MMKLLSLIPGWPLAGVRGLLCSLTGGFAFACMAQTPGPVPTLTGPTFAPGGLGTLILSPAERRRLEILRNTVGSPEGVAAAQPADRLLGAASDLPDTLVVSGVVVRSGNRSTVWVNNQPLYGQAAVTPLRSLAGRAGVLQPLAKDMQLKARPGQVIDVPSGQIVDLLPPGAIRIIPPRAGTGRSTPKE